MAVELATAYVTLVPSALGITSGIKAALGGAEVQNVAAQAGQQASSSFASGFKKVGAALAAVGIAETLKKAVTSAADFQAQTELLVTAGGEAQSALASVRNGIEAIAVATGTSTSQLAEGMYTLEKAGLRGADGLNVLKVAAEGARAENVDLGTMTNALTSIMRSYNLPASSAVSVTNQLVAASGAAKTTMAEFAGSLSTVLPIAAASGLSFAQVGGAIATLTSHGTSAQEATQELASTIRSLQAPNQVAIDEMAQFGLNSNTVSTQLGKQGLTGTLNELTTAITSKMGPAGTVLLNAFHQSQGAAQDMQIEISKMPPSLQQMAKSFEDGQLTMTDWRKVAKNLPADQRLMMQGFMATYTQAHKFNDLLTSGQPAAQTYTAALSKMVGGATGLNTALMLTGGSAATFSHNVQTIAAASQDGGKDISTWAKTQQNFNVQMSRLGEVAQTTAINVGSALLPKLTAFGSWISNNAGAVKVGASALAALATAMLVGALGAKAFAAAEGVYNVVTGEATAKTGLQVVALGVQKAAMLAASAATKAYAAAMWVLDAALDGNPIVLLVIGLAALVAGLVLAYQHSATFRAAVEDVWKAVQVAAGAIAGAFVDTWHAVVSAFDSVTSFLKQWGPLILTIIAPFIGLPLLIVTNWKTIVTALSSIFSTVVSDMGSFFTALPGRVLALLAALPDALATVAGDAIGAMIIALLTAAVGLWDFFTKLVPTAVKDLVGFDVQLASVAAKAVAAMAAALAAAALAVWAFFTNLPGNAVRLMGALAGDLRNAGAAALAGMAAGVAAGAAAVWSFFTNLPGKVLSLIGNAGAWLVRVGSNTVAGFVSGLQGGIPAIAGWVAGLPGRIGSMFAGCVNWLTGAGEQLVNGFIHGIEGMAGALVNAIKSTITDHLPGFVKSALGIKSPSRVFMEIGRNVMAGLVVGITQSGDAPASAMQHAVAKMTGTVNAGQVAIASATSAGAGPAASGRQAPTVGQINVTAYDPVTAARETAAEIGWLQLTRGQ